MKKLSLAKPPLEKDIQDAICQYLTLKKYFFWRQNTGGIFDTKRGAFRSMPKYSMNGVPDLILIKSGGTVCFLEVKRPKGRQSPDQWEFQQRVERLGAEYYVVTSIEDVKNLDL